MNTPTPRTDEWETYCDEWYYHLWRLRRKNERGFNDGFHINNGDEAKGLCDLLNNLEAKLTAVTEQRDRLAEALQSIKCELGVPQPEYPSPLANAYWIADKALQSLKQDHFPDVGNMIGTTTTLL